MLTSQERNNMIYFLVRYFQSDYNQLLDMSDESLESIYDYAYYQTELERDL